MVVVEHESKLVDLIVGDEVLYDDGFVDIERGEFCRSRSYAVGGSDLLLQLTNSWLVKEACVGNERGD